MKPGAYFQQARQPASNTEFSRSWFRDAAKDFEEGRFARSVATD
jgi:hypothetical protein